MSNLAGKYNFLGMRKVFNLGLKAGKKLGSQPRDNGHVSHSTYDAKS